MYTYTKKSNVTKNLAIIGLLLALVLAMLISYKLINPQKSAVPVTKKEDLPVIKLEDTKQKAIRPYKVGAKIVLDYFDGNSSEIGNVTEFEGVYRANQGIDYALDNQEFDVVAILEGKVVDAYADSVFGNTLKIESENVIITYQSLKDLRYKKGDTIKQGDNISLASTNIYNAALKNHVHIVVTKDLKLVDPENIYGKTISEIK